MQRVKRETISVERIPLERSLYGTYNNALIARKIKLAAAGAGAVSVAAGLITGAHEPVVLGSILIFSTMRSYIIKFNDLKRSEGNYSYHFGKEEVGRSR